MTKNSAPSADPTLLVFRHIQGKKILIVDPSVAVRSSVINIFKDLGARHADIAQTRDYESALTMIEKKPPQILICDYNLEGQSGLALVSARNKLMAGEKELFTILITANARETAIVDAVEGEVDCYILKPFTARSFREHVIEMISEKISSGPYRKAIENGKALLAKKEFDSAESELNAATALHPRPLLALYYLGRARLEAKAFDRAQEAFEAALKIEPHHFRSLTGLFDLHRQTGKEEDAYGTAKRMIAAYPVSSVRLQEILHLAIRCQHFEDIALLYEQYLDVEFRTPELMKAMIASLLIAGKHALKENARDRAIEFFKKAMVSSGRSFTVLKEVVHALLKHGDISHATGFLLESPQDQRTLPEFRSLDYEIMDRDPRATAAAVYEQGVKLVREQVFHSKIYEILVRRSLEIGKSEMAETFAFDASRRWPEDERFKVVLKEPTKS